MVGTERVRFARRCALGFAIGATLCAARVADAQDAPPRTPTPLVVVEAERGGPPCAPWEPEWYLDPLRALAPQWSPLRPVTEVDRGVGFIARSDGRVVTSRALVAEAERVLVALDDGRRLEARVLREDPRTGVAVLAVQAGAPLPCAPLRTDEQAGPGQRGAVPVGERGERREECTFGGVVEGAGEGPALVFASSPTCAGAPPPGAPLLDEDGAVLGVEAQHLRLPAPLLASAMHLVYAVSAREIAPLLDEPPPAPSSSLTRPWWEAPWDSPLWTPTTE